MDYRKISFWQLLLLSFLLNFVVQFFHEAGHWIICETTGHWPIWGFTQLLQIWGDTPPVHPNEWIQIISPDGDKGWLHLASPLSKNVYNIMLVAGPLFSVFGVLIGLSLMKWNRVPATKQLGLVMALIGSLIMTAYYLRGFSRKGGDEYFLAASLGIPKYIIDIPFAIIFVLAFIAGVWSLGDWRTRLKWLGVIVLGSIPAGMFFMNTNGLILAQVDQGNPFFRPVLGWSMPVFIFNLIVCLGLWIWWKRTTGKFNYSVINDNA